MRLLVDLSYFEYFPIYLPWSCELFSLSCEFNHSIVSFEVSTGHLSDSMRILQRRTILTDNQYLPTNISPFQPSQYSMPSHFLSTFSYQRQKSVTLNSLYFSPGQNNVINSVVQGTFSLTFSYLCVTQCCLTISNLNCNVVDLLCCVFHLIFSFPLKFFIANLSHCNWCKLKYSLDCRGLVLFCTIVISLFDTVGPNGML